MISIVQSWELRLRRCALQKSTEICSNAFGGVLIYWPKLQALNCAFRAHLDQTHPLSHLICHQAPPLILVPAMQNILLFSKKFFWKTLPPSLPDKLLLFFKTHSDISPSCPSRQSW